MYQELPELDKETLIKEMEEAIKRRRDFLRERDSAEELRQEKRRLEERIKEIDSKIDELEYYNIRDTSCDDLLEIIDEIAASAK